MIRAPRRREVGGGRPPSEEDLDVRNAGSDRNRPHAGRTAAAGAGVLVGAAGLEALVPSFAAAKTGGVTKGDLAILGAAQIAEALAVTTTRRGRA